MNMLLVLSSLLVVALARPHSDDAGTVSVRQSSAGTYKYVVNLKDSSRTEERLADGSVVGEYTVLGIDGKPHTFKYTAGVDGFRIVEGPVPQAPVDNNVAPLPVQETPEVLAARQLPVLQLSPELSAIEDTPEVKAAKEAFYAVYNAALKAAATS
ncbi:uncharacterized protein LOC143204937 [Rhynchophorus ferrugineus]|uniref:Uncharacterized protein n=1 Tax=Rhynchophorus ferrugineus TaxID=354439 RepID=A0A834IMD2_RHYFE|nr:hypothetical protein GWI33_023103 [Rhynchophorus ferrugineus]